MGCTPKEIPTCIIAVALHGPALPTPLTFRVLPGVIQIYKHTPPLRLTGICSHVFTGTKTSVDHAGTVTPTS